MSDKPHCASTTKAGSRCSRYALDGHTTCLAHASLEVKASKGFGGSAAGSLGGRPKTPRVVDLLRAKLEEDADKIVAVYREAMEAERAVVVGNGPEATMEFAADHPTRVRAADAYQDRVVGRPKQTAEITGAEGRPLIPPVLPTDGDWSRDVREALAGVYPMELANGNGNGPNGNGHH